MKSVRDILLSGDLPYVAALVFMAAGFYAGVEYKGDAPRVVIAERGAVILEAVLERHDAAPETLEKEISQPVMAVLRKYADLGYVVIDSSKDEAGHYMVAALPAKIKDITAELRDAIQKPQPTTKPASISEAITPPVSAK
jgi:hypothetical protein